MMSILTNVGMFALGLLGLSFLVFIHELGHFLVAKHNGVRVNTFSIGFGKKLFRIRRGGTEYCISMVPFGGYVAMAGEDPEDLKEGETPKKDDFVAQSVGVRAAIAFAGPFVNILFAFVLLMCLYMKGVEEADTNNLIVGFVAKNSAAAASGILPGDTIVSVNGKATSGWDDFRERVGISLGAKLAFGVHRESGVVTLYAVPRELKVPSADSSGREINMGIGDIGVYPRNRVMVRLAPEAGSPAKLAGLVANDTILSINGSYISRYEDVVDVIGKSNGEALDFRVLRGSDTLSMSMKARYSEKYKRYMVGVQMAYVMFRETHIVRRGPIAAFNKSCATSWKMTTSIFRYFKRLFQGQVKMDAFSGPVTIVAVMGNVWMAGFNDFLMLLALISINLGVMNLLPLAITDGGLLMFLAIEKVRGRPLSKRKRELIQKGATIFFIGFFIFITLLDFNKLSLFLK